MLRPEIYGALARVGNTICCTDTFHNAGDLAELERLLALWTSEAEAIKCRLEEDSLLETWKGLSREHKEIVLKVRNKGDLGLSLLDRQASGDSLDGKGLVEYDSQCRGWYVTDRFLAMERELLLGVV